VWKSLRLDQTWQATSLLSCALHIHGCCFVISFRLLLEQLMCSSINRERFWCSLWLRNSITWPHVVHRLALSLIFIKAYLAYGKIFENWGLGSRVLIPVLTGVYLGLIWVGTWLGERVTKKVEGLAQDEELEVGWMTVGHWGACPTHTTVGLCCLRPLDTEQCSSCA